MIPRAAGSGEEATETNQDGGPNRRVCDGGKNEIEARVCERGGSGNEERVSDAESSNLGKVYLHRMSLERR